MKDEGKPAIKDSNSNQVKNKFWDAMFNRQIPRRDLCALQIPGLGAGWKALR